MHLVYFLCLYLFNLLNENLFLYLINFSIQTHVVLKISILNKDYDHVNHEQHHGKSILF